tara:strand:- start:468 stop:737 length:270 start_codon:yes stop_codon:yes gene_type:complete
LTEQNIYHRTWKKPKSGRLFVHPNMFNHVQRHMSRDFERSFRDECVRFRMAYELGVRKPDLLYALAKSKVNVTIEEDDDAYHITLEVVA